MAYIITCDLVSVHVVARPLRQTGNSKSVTQSVTVIGVAGYGARASARPSPWTSNCLIFLLTSEPHNLWNWSLYGCIPTTQKRIYTVSQKRETLYSCPYFC